MRYEIDSGPLAADAAVVEEVVARLARLRPEAALDLVRAGFVGSETARCVDQLGDAWAAHLRAVRAQLRSLGDGLAHAASSYDAVEEVARRALSPAAREPR